MSHREPASSGPRRLLRGVLVALPLGLICAGCSNGSPSGAADSSSTSTTTTAVDPHAQAVTFAECMRQNGYAEFPDPEASGEFPSFGISVSPEVWVAALEACKDLQPPGTFSAERSPEELSAALRFAQCVRDHGVKDFPDPVSGEPMIDTTKIPSTDGEAGMDILHAAIAACRDRGQDAVKSQQSQP